MRFPHGLVPWAFLVVTGVVGLGPQQTPLRIKVRVTGSG